jgi:hypothetical protein
MALDPRAAALAAEDVRKQAERRAAESALREVLRTSAGRTWVSWQLRELCGVFEGAYLPGAEGEKRHTDYNEGRRFVGLETLKASGARLDLFKQFEERGAHGGEEGHARGAGRGGQKAGRRPGQKEAGRGGSGGGRGRAEEEEGQGG